MSKLTTSEWSQDGLSYTSVTVFRFFVFFFDKFGTFRISGVIIDITAHYKLHLTFFRVLYINIFDFRVRGFSKHFLPAVNGVEKLNLNWVLKTQLIIRNFFSFVQSIWPRKKMYANVKNLQNLWCHYRHYCTSQITPDFF